MFASGPRSTAWQSGASSQTTEYIPDVPPRAQTCPRGWGAFVMNTRYLSTYFYLLFIRLHSRPGDTAVLSRQDCRPSAALILMGSRKQTDEIHASKQKAHGRPQDPRHGTAELAGFTNTPTCFREVAQEHERTN